MQTTLPILLVDLAAGRTHASGTVDAATEQLARDHRLDGLLWQAVRQGTVTTTPEIQRSLALRHMSRRMRHVALWEALESCATAMADLGIPLGTFKGVTTESLLYGELGLRPSNDLDLFIPVQPLDRLVEVIRALGPSHPDPVALARVTAASGGQTVDLLHPSGVWIDVHFDVMKWEIETKAHDSVWERAVPFQLESGQLVSVLDPTMSLINACINLNRDRFRTLLGFADVVRSLDQEIDWDFLIWFTRHEGFDVHVAETLRVVADVMAVPLPSAAPTARGVRAALWRRVWNPSIRLPGTKRALLTSRRRYFWGPILARGRIRDSIRWWMRRLYPLPEVVAYRYPDTSGPTWWRLIRGRLGKRQRVQELRRRLDEETTEVEES